MKILKARNGIALVAVLTIMLISSLFIPLMFNLSDTSLYVAVKNSERQRANYFARTITEMCVASFTKIDTKRTKDNPDEDEKLNNEEKAFVRTIINMSDPDSANYDPTGKIETQTIYMLSKMDNGEEVIEYASDETVKNELISSGFVVKGEGSCTITFDGTVNYYKVKNDGTKEEIFPATTKPGDEGYKAELSEREKNYMNMIRILDEDGNPKLNGKKVIDGEYTKAVKNGTADYTLTKIQNKNLVFTATATVRGIKAEKQCVVVMKSTPSQEDSLVFGSPDIFNTGGNQIFVDPNKATAIMPISYGQTPELGGVQNQPLLIYSYMGNMVIQPHKFLDSYPADEKLDGAVRDENGRVTGGYNGTTLELGIAPGINYNDDNNPDSNIIAGVNYAEQKYDIQYNNFVAFAASNAIRVELPINLMVNPCRTGRPGDWKIDVGAILGGNIDLRPNNASLFKIMIFQSPIVQFAGKTTLMMSCYPMPEKAYRMSSIVLTAPENTPYSYYNEARGKTVKAGMVYFEQDCELWLIEYDNSGVENSSLETIYRKNKDFKKTVIFKKGDVYYFNTEVPSRGTSGKDEKVGVSLTGYWMETQYAEKLDEDGKGSGIWNETRHAVLKSYINQQDKMYVEDDMFYLGNIYEVGSGFDVPPIEDYYVVWTK